MKNCENVPRKPTNSTQMYVNYRSIFLIGKTKLKLLCLTLHEAGSQNSGESDNICRSALDIVIVSSGKLVSLQSETCNSFRILAMSLSISSISA